MCLACCPLLLGCGDDVDEAGADALWDEIHERSYDAWERAPGYDAPQPTVRAHGETALVYLSPIASDALAKAGLEAWPQGSIFVKDSFRGGERSLLAAIERQTDGWFFAEWSASGEVKYAGEPEVCTNCHGTGANRILAVALPGP
jgi:hypothetical protein